MISAIKKYILSVLLSVIFANIFTGCQDDIDFRTIGVGESQVSCEVAFHPLVSALGSASRTAGDAIKDIKTLNVIIYDSNGNYVKDYNQDQLESYSYTVDGNKDMPDIKPENPDPGHTPSQAEATTARATFNLPDPLPFGRYRIYVVANVPQDIIEKYKEDINALKKHKLDWDSNDIASNNAMFGYFTNIDDSNSGAYGFDAQLLVVEKNMQSIHAWIKRAASKITIAFDGSKLHQDVWIYIKSVTLRDIPKTCYLGAVNKPESYDQLYNSKDNDDNSIINNSVLYYDINDTIPRANSGDVADPGEDFHNWMRIANGLGDIKCHFGSTHTEYANALYFFENNQGDFEGDGSKDKRQQWDGVGNNITKPGDSAPNGDKDYKDKVDYGTYIEVEAYYVSRNIHNISSGPIKYRFMLGKNITYNYNAERNHHFKLTLGFKGWANQPDWHIEYDEPEPGLYVPETFYVSYLYNQIHQMPIKLVGNCTGLSMKIIENNWAPCDTAGNVPGSPVGSGSYAFKWNTVAYSKYNGKDYPYLGFLALRVPTAENNLPPKNIIADMTFASGTKALTALKDYYEGGCGYDQSQREFTGEQLDPHGGDGNGNYSEGIYNGWKVTRIDNESTMLSVPLFTRNKSMITASGYSGNNPYEAYQRKAIVEVIATFKVGDRTETRTKKVRVMQAKRVVNPKGVWRKQGDTRSFHVQLAVVENGGDDKFVPLESQGSWEAFVEVPTGGASFVNLTTVSQDTTRWKLDEATGKIIGKTSTPIDFNINFSGGSEGASQCAVIRVNYHGNNCVHKILVRQGYAAPIQVIGNNYWSSYSLYGAKYINEPNVTDGINDRYNATLTENPIAFGSFFRRGMQSKAILASNEVNNANVFGPMKAPGTNTFELFDRNSEDWDSIGFRNDLKTEKMLGTFLATVNGKNVEYRVPSWDDFNELMEAEFGYGVIYGDGATETQMEFDKAFGFQDSENSGAESELGARGIFVYNRTNANQIFFPVGKNGMGRRRHFNVSSNDYRGTLWYADVNDVLETSLDDPGPNPGLPSNNQTQKNWQNRYNKFNNQFRPIAYNLPIAPGAIYWIDQWVEKGYQEGEKYYPSLGWDMNYFNFDFNPYTQNNYRDACPIKLIVTKGY